MKETNELLPNPHPGITLLEDVMKPLGLTAYRIAKDIDVPTNRIDDIINGRRAISADTALRLGAYLKMSPQYWLNLQSRYELIKAERTTTLNIKPCRAVEAA